MPSIRDSTEESPESLEEREEMFREVRIPFLCMVNLRTCHLNVMYEIKWLTKKGGAGSENVI